MIPASRNAILFRSPLDRGGPPDRSRRVPLDAGCPALARWHSSWLNSSIFKNPLAEFPTTNLTTTTTQAVPLPGDTENPAVGLGYHRADPSLLKSVAVCRMPPSQVRADIFNLSNSAAFGVTGRNGGPHPGFIGPGSYQCFQTTLQTFVVSTFPSGIQIVLRPEGARGHRIQYVLWRICIVFSKTAPLSYHFESLYRI